ncbi:GNAT family N-acetyltransferase [Shewanella xiamenensis]|uniref:GNAT family N-acetyltransferase n=1 Tax=Shewanella xiamenensis TaxID=332186 RepID=A0AAE4Q2G6_9GAMM|nr:GNAT family N-acetyltransferase [Shewanella xiamenensis]PZP38180.1 MAG: N-acetyltransferase [Shewanella oneidensis]MBW0279545.1 GNAT family N-acetyltransferase [Shewanella xiamenensis]MCT8860662.1 GNAT family N-acetyltransferase [Shewanella xiamenensis]MCT8862224.1 GNAT family N-acetyltransferase [Shewanella xiamenensis]MCT8871746.1 GNAT family N-acetyltransferase [Shewanella xiamenensis]
MYSIEIKAITTLTPELAIQLIELSKQIPELDRPLTPDTLTTRLSGKTCLILLAYVEGELAGFKLGYEQEKGIFYSWLGGVATDFRRLGLAQSLLEYQEKWASLQGYNHIQVKTMNRFPAMLNLLIRNQYLITELNADPQSLINHKLHLSKSIVAA